MTITLPREQQEWLEAQVKAGYYDSIEEAVASIVAEQHAARYRRHVLGASSLSTKDVHRSKRDGGLTLEEHRKRMARRLHELDRK